MEMLVGAVLAILFLLMTALFHLPWSPISGRRRATARIAWEAGADD